MAKTKTQILAGLAASVAKAQKELDATAALIECLPDIEYEYIHGKGCATHADMLVKLVAKDLEAARLLTLVFPPVKLMKASDTFTSFMPRDADPKGVGRNPVRLEIAPVVFCCENVSGPEIEAQWWADYCGKRIAVHVRIDNPYTLTSWGGEKRMSHGSIHWVNESFSHRFANAKHTKWGSGSSEYRPHYTLYFDPCSTMEQVFELGEFRRV